MNKKLIESLWDDPEFKHAIGSHPKPVINSALRHGSATLVAKILAKIELTHQSSIQAILCNTNLTDEQLLYIHEKAPYAKTDRMIQSNGLQHLKNVDIMRYFGKIPDFVIPLINKNKNIPPFLLKELFDHHKSTLNLGKAKDWETFCFLGKAAVTKGALSREEFETLRKTICAAHKLMN